MIPQGGCAVAVIKYTDAELDLLARLMRAEAEGDGQLGMLLVGNVGVNRVRAACLDFNDIRTLQEYGFPKTRRLRSDNERYISINAPVSWIENLARRVVNGERFTPGERSLWFFMPTGDCPAQWYNQWNTGRFKSHCFYSPTAQDCPNL